MMSMCKEEIFENLIRIAAALTAQFSPSCEVIVQDLSRPEHSIVFVGGNITGRRIGGPATNFILRMLKDDKTPEDIIGNLAHTRDGKTLKSSTVFIKDRRGRPIGVFCVNFDTTPLLTASKQLAELAAPATPIEIEKILSADVPNLLQDMIQDSFRRVLNEKEPNEHTGGLSKEQRQAVLLDLEKQGALRIRNAVPILSDIFRVSRYTIYKDLKAIRANTGNGAS